MAFIYFVTLILLPVSSWAFSCHYNDSAVILRKIVLLELQDHEYIHISDAKFDIKLKRKASETTTLANQNLRFIEEISFKGYLGQEDDKEYIDVTLDHLKSYRYIKHGTVCRVSYQEAEGDGLNITLEQETAIIRLAESCIQSKICGFDLMEIDVDSDLYYQSVQSSLNGLVDNYFPKILNSLLDNDKILKTPGSGVSLLGSSLSTKGGIIKGIDTLQRANDVVIKHDKSQYKISTVVRFSELNILLKDITARYLLFRISGDLQALLHGVSLKINGIIDVSPPTCKITLGNIELISFKDIKLHLPIWGWFNFSYKLNSQRLWFFQKAILQYIVESVPKFHFDCEKHLDELSKFYKR